MNEENKELPLEQNARPTISAKILETIQNTMNQFFINGDPDKGETEIHTSFCVLYNQLEYKFNRYDFDGQGIVRILKHNETGRYRILMRSKENFDNVYLNHFILPGMEVQESFLKKGNVVINSKNYATGMLKNECVMFKFATKEIKEDFVEKYMHALSENHEILETI